jgi:hypothetical protein
MIHVNSQELNIPTLIGEKKKDLLATVIIIS